jgi:hypothetical protein
MTTNLHEMFGLPDKKVDCKARLIAATEHMRSEVKDVFRALDLDDDDPRQHRLMDACNAWVQAATEMADAHTDHVERRVAQISDKVIIKMRKEVEVAAVEKLRDMGRLYRPLVLVVALVAGMTGFMAGQYYSMYTEASDVRSSWLASPQPLTSKP